jgi:hypothetical protein
MKRGIQAYFLLLVMFQGYGQQLGEAPFLRIDVEDVDLVSFDNRGNIFYSDTKGNVSKLNDSGKVVNQYSPIFQGRLHQFDASFTMLLFMFSADLQQVILLDSHLAPLHSISFQDEGIGMVKAAALGNNNIIWLFDEVDLSLKKYDYRRGEILQVQPLIPLLGGDRIQVIDIKERQNLVFITIKDRGLWIFDNQANLIKKHDIQLHQPLAVVNDHIFFVKDKQIHRLNIYSGEEEVLQLPRLSGDKVAVGAQHMAIYSADTLFILPTPFDR